MSENKQKGKSGGQSKYALKKEAQSHGHYNLTSPFGSNRAQEVKQAEVKQADHVQAGQANTAEKPAI